jgi:hypothetical protein
LKHINEDEAVVKSLLENAVGEFKQRDLDDLLDMETGGQLSKQSWSQDSC